MVAGKLFMTFITEMNIQSQENPKIQKTKEDFQILYKIVRG